MPFSKAFEWGSLRSDANKPGKKPVFGVKNKRRSGINFRGWNRGPKGGGLKGELRPRGGGGGKGGGGEKGRGPAPNAGARFWGPFFVKQGQLLFSFCFFFLGLLGGGGFTQGGEIKTPIFHFFWGKGAPNAEGGGGAWKLPRVVSSLPKSFERLTKSKRKGFSRLAIKGFFWGGGRGPVAP